MIVAFKPTYLFKRFCIPDIFRIITRTHPVYRLSSVVSIQEFYRWNLESSHHRCSGIRIHILIMISSEIRPGLEEAPTPKRDVLLRHNGAKGQIGRVAWYYG